MTRQNKKHEKIMNDSRESITIVRSAPLAGVTGPTNFCLAGTKVKAGFNSAWLQRHGAATGSNIVMTPSAFMTDAAWVEMALGRAKGFRGLPVIRDHPDWWILEIFDGYGSHCNCPKALQMYYDHKIIEVKEEADTSHVCQLHDQDPAKKDKNRDSQWGQSTSTSCFGHPRSRRPVRPLECRPHGRAPRGQQPPDVYQGREKSQPAS
jgi:hypothetical protein